jgi:hypothetical protein
MEGIYNATNDFPFDKLVLLKPTAISGGNYFIKFKLNDGPVYIQTPKCTTKHGILKAGKRYFSDLMFNNEHESFIQWMEHLEEYSQTYIYNNRKTWFDTELELHDIENSFSSCIKLYKSGKYYILRTHVPTQLGKCSLKIYNESEELIAPEDVSDKHDVITILEIQGIKCSARSFQIEIEIKQMLVVRQNNLFERCILASGKSNSDAYTNIQQNPAHLGNTTENDTIPVIQNIYPDVQDTPVDENYLDTNKSTIGNTINYSLSSEKEDSNSLQNITDPTNDGFVSFSKIENPELNSNSSEVSNTNVSEPEEDINELKEIEFNLDNIPENEQVHIKTRNDVYYKMYQEAKRKAKLAKDLALSAYLEAKQIKNTYMLEDLDDSDSESEDYIIT